MRLQKRGEDTAVKMHSVTKEGRAPVPLRKSTHVLKRGREMHCNEEENK